MPKPEEELRDLIAARMSPFAALMMIIPPVLSELDTPLPDLLRT